MQSSFDNQETRVYQNSVPINEDLMGQTLVSTPRKKLLDGISAAQVIAASAAAATSMLLASKIGIAGSVIGAAVSSMVTVICSQLYRNALDASAEKLKLRQTPERSQIAFDNRAYVPMRRLSSGSTPYESGAYEGNPYVDNPYADEPRTANPYGDNPYGEASAQVANMRIAPTKLQARAAAKRNASARKIAFASLGIAALAVAVCVAVVLITTAGNGLGAKPESIFTSAPQSEETLAENPGDIEAGNASTALPSPDESDGATDGDTPSTPDGGSATDTPTVPDQGAGDGSEDAGTGGNFGSTPADPASGTGAGTSNGTSTSKTPSKTASKSSSS